MASSFWPYSHMSAISEVYLAIVESDLQTAPALEGGQHCPLDFPPQGLGVLDDNRGALGHFLDGVGTAVDVGLVVVLLALALEFSVQDIDGLVG